MSTTSAIDTSKLAKSILDGLDEYAGIVADDMKQAVKETAKEVQAQIKANAPIGPTGKYAKSWKRKVTTNASDKCTVTVYANEDGYRIAHLLNNGHATRNGGRVEGDGHITKAAEFGEEELEKKITDLLKG